MHPCPSLIITGKHKFNISKIIQSSVRVYQINPFSQSFCIITFIIFNAVKLLCKACLPIQDWLRVWSTYRNLSEIQNFSLAYSLKIEFFKFSKIIGNENIRWWIVQITSRIRAIGKLLIIIWLSASSSLDSNWCSVQLCKILGIFIFVFNYFCFVLKACFHTRIFRQFPIKCFYY